MSVTTGQDRDGHSQPGSARFGNFINYYSFNPADRRLNLIPSDLFSFLDDGHIVDSKFTVLDIGCNAGDLTIGLYERLTSAIMSQQGLIESEENSKHLDQSQIHSGLSQGYPDQYKNHPGQSQGNSGLSQHHPGQCRDHPGQSQVHSGESRNMLDQFDLDVPEILEVSKVEDVCVLGVDLDEMLIERCKQSNPHSQHIHFQVANVMDTTHREKIIKTWLNRTCHGCKRYNLVTCFSLTLWIHLNHGDSGLQDFLHYISSISWYILLEPQPWKCYRTARRRQQKLGCTEYDQWSKLQWRESVDADILKFLEDQCDTKVIQTLGTTEWERKVVLLRCS